MSDNLPPEILEIERLLDQGQDAIPAPLVKELLDRYKAVDGDLWNMSVMMANVSYDLNRGAAEGLSRKDLKAMLEYMSDINESSGKKAARPNR